jgi:putative hydrolase of the HAD superfamily
MIKAILFDLDETLVDRTNSIACYIHRLYHRYQLPPEGYPAFYQRFVELDQHGYAVRAEVFATLIQEFAVATTLEVWLDDFRQNAWTECLCFPDVDQVLNTLRGRGYQLGIITNGSRASQRAKIQAAKLDSYMDVILVSEEEGIKKPDPAIFLRAAEQLNVAPGACLFIGDHPDLDIMGAQAVGMQAVWVPRHLPWPAGQAQSCHIVTTLAEIMHLLPSEPFSTVQSS